MVREQPPHGRPEQGREVAGQRGHDEHRRTRRVGVLLEVEEVAERGRVGDRLVHGAGPIGRRDLLDPEGRPVVAEPGPRDQLGAGPEQAGLGGGGEPRRQRVEHLGGERRPRGERRGEVALGLVGRVQHRAAACLRAPGGARRG